MSSQLDLEALAAELTTLNQTIETMTERRDQILDLLRTRLPEASKTQAGDYTITLTKAPERLNLKAVAEKYGADQYPTLYQAELNPAAVTEKYPPNQHPELYQPAIQKDQVEAQFSPQALRAGGFYTTGKPRVSIK